MPIISAPFELQKYRQFVLWRLVPDPNGGKPRKIPFDPKTGHYASVADRETWTDYETALRAYYTASYNGIGFVFTADDPFVFLDIDGCFDPLTQVLSPAAQFFHSVCQFAVWEVSQSGQGFHAIMRVSDKKALGNRSKKFLWGKNEKVEFYSEKRFIAFGKCNWWGDVALAKDSDLIIASLIPLINTEQPGGSISQICSITDKEIIERARKSKSPAAMFGTRISFDDLWNANPVQLGKFYPDANGRPFDNSSAEQALANILMYPAEGDIASVERIMSASPLCQREKWIQRPDYRQRTIEKARNSFLGYRRAEQKKENEIIGADLSEAPLPTILTLDQMISDFVHVGNGGQVVHRNTKRVRAKDDAISEYAGSTTYIDTGKFDGSGKSIFKPHKSLRLWQEANSRISVDEVTWQPAMGEFCRTLEQSERGDRAYNLWRGLQICPCPENWLALVTPFIQHVEYLVPNETERQRFLEWLAHIFQCPGELPHTAYLFIATTTGIGRNTLASMLTRALRGYVAANIDVNILVNKGFNGRLSQKLLATVDEIREGGGSRWQQAENLKSALTEETRLINPKFGRQYIEKNCCRFLMFSNHLDALPFDNNDRRIIVIENPTTPAEPKWFEYLHSRMRDISFIASIQKYLTALDISNFRPGDRAPMNEAKRKSLESMASPVEAAARQFAAEWPGELATISDLRRFIGEDAAFLKAAAISHLVDRVGMKTAPRRVTIGGNKETVLIVRGGLTPQDILVLPADSIIAKVSEARRYF